MQPTVNKINITNIFAFTIAFLAWFSIILQLYLTTGSISNFFSYFTVLCNLLVALSLTISLLIPASKPGTFFLNLSVQSAIALYIFIVSLVYNLVLRGILVLTGWHLFVDNMLHVVVPILYILFWLFFRTKGGLKWGDVIYWICFPLIYLVYFLLRGSITKWYPYPFLNAIQYGYTKVFFNIFIILIVFVAVGLGLIFITRLIKNKKTF